MEEKRYPILGEEESVGMVSEPTSGLAVAFTTYDDGSTSDEESEKLDWDRFPSYGPFSEEEAIARIDEFEGHLAKGEVEWIKIDDLHAKLKKLHPWL